MKIIKVECLPITSMFSRPFPMGGGTEVGSSSVLLKLHTDEGIVGIADSGGIAYWYRGESQDSVMSVILNHFAPKLLLGADPFNIERIVADMDYITRDNNQAKAIVDYALHDIVGKALNVPVYKLLGGKSLEKIKLCYVLSEATPEACVETALKAKDAGYTAVKVKLADGPFESDYAKVKLLRETLGDDFTIFADANGGWDYYQALCNIKKLERFDLQLFEQPLPWWDVDGLVRLHSHVGTPIYADESATELSQVLDLMKKDAVDGFLIKVCKVGGLTKAMKFMALAKAAGLPVCCGCMMGNGLEAAPQAHFLTACEWASKQYHENLGPLHLHDCFETVSKPITDDVALNVLKYENGYQYAPEGPGLGVDLNEELLPKIITPGKAVASVQL